MENNYTKIYLGNLELDEVRNIVREIKGLWRYLDNVYPNGSRKDKADIKITRDKFGQYHAHMNPQALTFTLLFCKNLQAQAVIKQTTDKPMPTGFLLDPSTPG